MKNIFKIMLIAVLLYGCNDAIEIEQDGELNNARLFTSVANMQLVLNDVYSRLNTRNELLVSSILTDEVALGDAGFPSGTHNFQIFSTNGFAGGIWSQHYVAINRANRLIEGASLFTPPAGDLATYNNIIAQARAVRAFSHLQLLTYFSTDMSNNEALGVMKLDFVPSIEQQVPRSTNGEVFELIESDFAFCDANLTNSISGPQSWYFFNRNVINALRARMYLYRKDFVLAEQYANLVINTSGLSLATSTFSLPPNFPTQTSETAHVGATGANSFDSAPPAGTIQAALFLMDRWDATTFSPNYKKMWVDAIQGEAIFSLARPNNSNSFSSAYNTNQSYTGGAPLYDMGRNLYDIFTEPLGNGAQDFRRWAFVDRSATILADPLAGTQVSEVIVIDKYPGKAGSHNSNDIKVLRISEMFLIKAECRAEANDFTGVANVLQELRAARNYIESATVPTPSYSNQTAAYSDILLERRKELCFEGHRYIDLKRIGAKAGVSETDRFIKDSENASATNPFNIGVNDFRFTLPIPQSEINVNPMPQNPGDTY